MEINGVAHVVLRANRYEECIPFYDRLMAELGPQAVHRDDSFVYYGGGRTALQIRRAPRAWIISASEPAAGRTSTSCIRCCRASART